MAVELNIRSVPHTIPGYTGHCPQYKYHKYIAYGAQGHKLVLSPNCKGITEKYAEYGVKHEGPLRIEEKIFEPKPEDLAKKYVRIIPKPFKYPPSSYDPYLVTEGPDTIYNTGPMTKFYAGHIPGEHHMVGKTFAYISNDAKKWFRWTVNGVGWQY